MEKQVKAVSAVHLVVCQKVKRRVQQEEQEVDEKGKKGKKVDEEMRRQPGIWCTGIRDEQEAGEEKRKAGSW